MENKLDANCFNDCVIFIFKITNLSYEEIIRRLINTNCLAYLISVGNNTAQFTHLSLIVKIVGNCLTGNSQLIKDILDLNVLSFLEKCIENPDSLVCKNSVWAISNIASDELENLQQLVNSDIVPKVFELAKTNCIDVIKEVIFVASGLITGADSAMVDKLKEFYVTEMLLYLLST